ncbi:uncharacterized protein BDV17DRAFT_281552 [Aspergillus undulatus]|uniref:uncharacterized protein n=1 Tax=Aspergillus undulatus TaxID=1810928 RepID=UPI003CCE09AC
MSTRRSCKTAIPDPFPKRESAVYDESLFHFTRGRLLTNESRELAQRYATFNGRAAEAASDGPRKCVEIEKLADGMHNKAVRFTMDDSFPAVGKIPNLNAGLPHFTTASEVATMDSMRNVLGTPVPKFFSWSSSADNPVAAEYILTENARGVSLSKIWNTLDVEVQFKVLKKIAEYQRAWSEVSFSKYGEPGTGLDYKYREGKNAFDDKFAVGPGPWRSFEEYERATNLRESYCGEKSYLKLVKLLLPEDEAITTSHIWHDDIHVENVLVNPDDPSEINAFIDWQSTEMAPLYNHTIEPYILEYNGPPLENLLERASLSDIQALLQTEPEPIAERKAGTLFTSMSLVSSYRFLLFKHMPRLFKALEFRQTDSFFQLLLLVRNILIDGEATCLGLLAQQQENKWTGIPRICEGKEAPLSFLKEDIQSIEPDSEAAARSMELMGDLRRMIGSQYFQAQGLRGGPFLREHARSEEERLELYRAWPF